MNKDRLRCSTGQVAAWSIQQNFRLRNPSTGMRGWNGSWKTKSNSMNITAFEFDQLCQTIMFKQGNLYGNIWK